MKLNGRTIQGPNVEYVVIPRHDGDIVFKCQAVLKMDEFNKLCPAPKPPEIMKPGGAKEVDTSDPTYKAMVQRHLEKRWGYTVLKSLSANEIEWDTVDLENPETWPNFEQDLENAGFSFQESQLIQMGVSTANGTNPDKLNEARMRFLASLQLADKS
jgi:hypothetical protein